MIAFIFSAICFSVVFMILLITQPLGHDRISRFSESLLSKGRGSRILTVFFYASICLVPFLLLCFITGQVHPEYSEISSVYRFIYSPSFINSTLGAIFGTVFIIWIYRIYRIPTSEPIPRFVKIEGIFLLALFFIGSLDVISPYINRLSGLKLGVAEFSFFQAAPRVIASDPRIGPTSQGGVYSHIIGLQQLQRMAPTINNDNQYIYFIKPPNDRQSNKTDQFGLFVENSISPIADCQSEIYNQGFNINSLRNDFGKMIVGTQMLRNLFRYSKSDDTNFKADLIYSEKAFIGGLSEVARATVGRAEVIDILSLFNGKRNGDLIHKAQSYANALAKSCYRLVSLPCSSGDDNTRKSDFDYSIKSFALTGPLTASFQEFEDKRLSYCRSVCLGDDFSDESQNNKSKDQCNGIYSIQYILQQTDFLKSYIDIILLGRLDQTISSDMDSFFEHPYLSLIYAGLMALEGQPDAGIEDLSQWPSQLDKKQETNPWYKIRVLIAIRDQLDELSKQRPVSSRVFKQFVIKNYLKIIDAIDSQSALIKPGKRFFQSDDKIETRTDVDLNPHDSGVCRISSGTATDAERYSIFIAYSEITTIMNFVDKALDDPDFIERYSQVATSYLHRLNAVDFSCLYVTGIDEDTLKKLPTIHHAEILRLNAKYLLVMATDLASLDTTAETTAKLRSAFAQAQSSRRLLSQLNSDAVGEREKQSTYLKSIEASDEIENYDHTLNTIAEISAKLQD